MSNSQPDPGVLASLPRDSTGLLELMILRIPGLRTAEKTFLCREFTSAGDLTKCAKPDIESLIGRSLTGEPWDMAQIRTLAERDLELTFRRGIKMIVLSDRDYPPLVREIFDPPAVLFYRGMLPNPEHPLAAMVGTRRPSPEAAAFAYELGRDLGRAGIPVVSGLALGIDAFSHRGNVDAGAPAVAVLGSGLDQVYPASNRSLAGRILDAGGALISEYPPEMGPRKWHFPARNRIISALARGTVIVEAPEKSGALITAGFVLEQDRDLWVARAGIKSHQGKGTAKLAAEGAVLIDSAQDILVEWNLLGKTAGPDANVETEFGNNGGVDAAGKSLAASLARKLKIDI